MALQSSGAISLGDIQTEFGGSNPIGIDEYYSADAGVPASGTISLDDFYGTSAGPSVSARIDGRFNSAEGVTVYSGFQLRTDGNEYEYGATGSATNVTTWLDSGTSSEVWVEWNRTGGTQSDWTSPTGQDGVRLQLSSQRDFYITKAVGIGSITIQGYCKLYDAASGGNTLQTTSTVTWTADRTVDGCPTCCFTPDTLITMADGTYKPIVDVQEGDAILVLDIESQEFITEQVTGIITRTDRKMYKTTFDDGTVLKMSEDHPLNVVGKGASSINPDPTVSYKELGVPRVLKVGDQISQDSYGDGKIITKIEDYEYPETVYTLANANFFANQLLVY